MKLRRRPTEEEQAWQQAVDLWDAAAGELKVKVDRARERVDKEADDDERR